MSDAALADYLLEALEPAGCATLRRMFGGIALYLDGVVMGLVYDDTAYFKADDRTRPDYEAAGSKPFLYVSRGRTIAMSYWEVPAAILDEPEALQDWARKARAASLRARDPDEPASRRKKPAALRQPNRKAGSRRARRDGR
jgi:DNA transformation protein